MPNPYYFSLRRSPILMIYLCSIHIFAVLCIRVFSGVLVWIFLLIIVVSFLQAWIKEWVLYPHYTVMALQYNQKTEWTLWYVDGSHERVNLLKSSVMLRYGLILHFQGARSSRRKAVVVLVDSMHARDFQSLRRCVKMGFL